VQHLRAISEVGNDLSSWPHPHSLFFKLGFLVWGVLSIGGNALATCLFGVAGVWAIGVRTFNYEGHGRGKDRRKVGSDFNKDDIAINQLWPGYVAGEWHSNHHLYPSSARSGFFIYPIGFALVTDKWISKVGINLFFRDDKKEFLRVNYEPYSKGEKFPSIGPFSSGVTKLRASPLAPARAVLLPMRWM